MIVLINRKTNSNKNVILLKNYSFAITILCTGDDTSLYKPKNNICRKC